MPLVDYDGGDCLLSNVGFDQRKNFIVKVYSLLTIQLLVTFGMVTVACFSQGFRDLLINPQSYHATAFYWSMFAVSFVTEIAIFCFKNVARKVPNNYIALTIFTISFSFVVAGSCAVCKDAFENGTYQYQLLGYYDQQYYYYQGGYYYCGYQYDYYYYGYYQGYCCGYYQGYYYQFY
ncbi:unnamed protein product [Paramecium sonneborni]|uniref:Uncharacterized protein n=1 Tax=Paramecium sonneborni TaxID=65129 RepID=A0A8S1RDJ1_9CILI|nr:unnamed protein product [Paramecium sonneborni]